MKNNFAYILFLLIVLILTACGKEAVEPNIVGYVVAEDNHRILVVSKTSQDFSENGGVSEYFDAVSLSNIPKDIQVGQLVKVWYDGPVAESYPMQAKIGDLEIIEVSKPKGATLTEAEAIKKVLEKHATAQLAIKSIEFDQDLNVWKFEVKELLQDKSFQVEIED